MQLMAGKLLPQAEDGKILGQTRLQIIAPQKCQVRRVISFAESLLSQVMLQIGVLKALWFSIAVL